MSCSKWIMDKNKFKKIFGIIKGIINTIIVVVVLSFVLMVCLQRFSNNRVSFLNYRMFTVVTGSMEPKYNIGDVLVAKETLPSKIKVGDDVSYLGNYGTFNGKVVTHRVIKIEQDIEGKYVFHTKGLANLVEDPVVHENQLYGVVVGEIGLLSFVYKIVSNKNGMFLFIIIPLLYIIASEMIGFMLEKEEKRRRKLKESKNEEIVVDEITEDKEEKNEKKKVTKKKNKK